jgi:hypothetical protein
VTSCRTVRAANPFPTPLRLTRLRAIARSYAGPMIQLAFITQGDSQYDDRLWRLLEGTGIDPHEFEGLDYYGLVPFFVLSGAQVRPQAHAHGVHVHTEGVFVEVEDELEEGFYTTLPEILDMAYSDDEGTE